MATENKKKMPWVLVGAYAAACLAVFLTIAFAQLPINVNMLLAVLLLFFTGIVSYATSRTYRRK